MSPAQRRHSSGETAEAHGRFSADERAAMRERAAELKRERRRGRADAANAEGEVLAKIAELPEADRRLAERLHTLIRASAPALTPRTWYGMPAYAKDGKVLCFFQSAHKFNTRYATLGFSDIARLDDGAMWPVAFALKELTNVEEERIRALLAQAMG